MFFGRCRPFLWVYYCPNFPNDWLTVQSRCSICVSIISLRDIFLSIFFLAWCSCIFHRHISQLFSSTESCSSLLSSSSSDGICTLSPHSLVLHLHLLDEYISRSSIWKGWFPSSRCRGEKRWQSENDKNSLEVVHGTVLYATSKIIDATKGRFAMVVILLA